MDVQSAVALVDARLAEVSAARGIPAIAYGLILGGELVHAASVGSLPEGVPPESATFRIASMTKSFTAATVLALRDQGLLSLDAPVSDLLPWAGTMGLPAGSPPIRVVHLLTMTAGFPTDDPWGDRQEPLPLPDFDRLIESGLTFCRPPGLDFEYANIGYALLGRVIAQVTGMDYRDCVASTLLEPLGMSSTTFDIERARHVVDGWHPTADGLRREPEKSAGAFSPMGGLWSTVGDLSRWVAFLEESWADAPGGGPLSRWSRREMQCPHIVIGQESDSVVDSYGLGLRIADHRELGRFVHHSGGYPGYGSHMRWHPATRWGVVALGNLTYAPVRQICAEILEEIVRDEAPGALRQQAVDRLWPQTERAMDLAESLLVRWDDAALDAVAAMNLDMDQAREERRDAWRALGAHTITRLDESVVSRSPAHARWSVESQAGPIELEVLMTGESPPRLQSLSARLAGDGARRG